MNSCNKLVSMKVLALKISLPFTCHVHKWVQTLFTSKCFYVTSRDVQRLTVFSALSLLVNLVWLSFLSLLFICYQSGRKASHVGMEMWCWLLNSHNECLKQMNSWLIMWHSDTNQNHNNCCSPCSQGKWSSLKLFCNLSYPLISQITKRKWILE